MPDESARQTLRSQALIWLNSELDRWMKFLESATPQQRQIVTRTLTHWQTDTDLAGLRDAAELSKLPESERIECESLWTRVEAILAQAPGSSNEGPQP